ncbi:MAG TPA: hypothetical protein VK929_12200 [Longimicrobiales bacterium]|nr:hypothetical protein [Longimicrobiales bacterium]
MERQRRQDIAAAVGAVVVGIVLFFTGWLQHPEMPDGPYHVEGVAAKEGMAKYGGRIVVAAAGNSVLRPGPVATSMAASTVVQRGGLIVIAAIAGEPTDSMAQLLGFYAPDGSEAALIAVQGTDVLYRQRTRASRFHLHDAAIRLPDGLVDVAPGDTLKIVTIARRDGRCIQVQDGESTCQLGLTAGSGWRLLAGDDVATGHTPAVLNFAWLALLLLPVGWLARPRIAAAILVAAVWYMVIRLPVDTVLMPAPATDVIGAALGIVAGGLVRWRVVRHRQPESPPAVHASG